MAQGTRRPRLFMVFLSCLCGVLWAHDFNATSLAAPTSNVFTTVFRGFQREPSIVAKFTNRCVTDSLDSPPKYIRPQTSIDASQSFNSGLARSTRYRICLSETKLAACKNVTDATSCNGVGLVRSLRFSSFDAPACQTGAGWGR